MYDVNFKDLLGEVFTSVQQTDGAIVFITQNDEKFVMQHNQDCCESVYIESIVGDLQDLVGEPIVRAEEAVSDEHPPGLAPDYEPERFLWTFYKLATRKGYVDIRWYGESNGYYGVSVDLQRLA